MNIESEMLDACARHLAFFPFKRFEGEEWIIMRNGTRVEMPSGKRLWRQKSHAKAALTNMLNNLMWNVRYDYEGEWDYRKADGIRQKLRDNNFEVITLKEWIDRGRP